MRGYQEHDKDLISYQLYELPGVRPHPQGGIFRGPPVTSDRYIACVGAAQTFGRFVRRPFPILLRESLGVETLNLGSGGAGPRFHNSNPRLLSYINRARLVIVQVLSARSESNSSFEARHYGCWGVRLEDSSYLSADQFYSDMLERDPVALRNIIAETRQNYLSNMVKLLDDITPPKVLFWFSTRGPDYREQYTSSLKDLFGAFPQLVNRAMVDELRKHANAYVECVSAVGMPQILTDDRGCQRSAQVMTDPYRTQRRSYNSYYPTPEMHREAAQALAPACRRLLRWPRWRTGQPPVAHLDPAFFAIPPSPPATEGWVRHDTVIRSLRPPPSATLPNDHIRKPPAAGNAVPVLGLRVKRQRGVEADFPRKISLAWNGTARHHRSGWTYALNSLAVLDTPHGVIFDDFIEKKFAWGGSPGDRHNNPAPYTQPWVGVVHNPPDVPEWFNFNQQAPQSILASQQFADSIPSCRGLFTLSSYLRDWLASRVPVPVESLLHPTGQPLKYFDVSDYQANTNKMLIQVGWWLRRFHSFYVMPVRLEKVLLNIDEPWVERVMQLELEFVPRSLRKDRVREIGYLADYQYDLLLSENVVFLDLYGSSANNAVIECIVRGTPLVIRRLKPIIEYLGPDYPLYFDSLNEAAHKAEDDDLVLSAHDYLMTLPIRKQLTGVSFVRSIAESNIYRSL